MPKYNSLKIHLYGYKKVAHIHKVSKMTFTIKKKKTSV